MGVCIYQQYHHINLHDQMAVCIFHRYHHLHLRVGATFQRQYQFCCSYWQWKMVSSIYHQNELKEKGKVCGFWRHHGWCTVPGCWSMFCLPFVCIRNITKSAVLRFVSILTGHGTSNLGPASTIFTWSPYSAIVVRLEPDHEEFMIAQLQTEGRTFLDAKKTPKISEKW